jgi:hypothetical protein
MRAASFLLAVAVATALCGCNEPVPDQKAIAKSPIRENSQKLDEGKK